MSSSTRSPSPSRWPGGASGFLVGNAEIVAALTKLKSYLDYGTFQPVQIAAIVAMNEAMDYPDAAARRSTSRVATRSSRDSIAWGGTVVAPRGSMFIWAPIPEPYREMGSLEFAKFLIEEADVATSPGVGFGDGGDDHVRFALIENELRTHQAVRNLTSRAHQARLIRAVPAPAHRDLGHLDAASRSLGDLGIDCWCGAVMTKSERAILAAEHAGEGALGRRRRRPVISPPSLHA